MKTNNIRKQFICLILSKFFIETLGAVNMPDSIQMVSPLEVADTLARIDNSPMALNVIEGTPSGALSDVYIRAMSGSNATQAMQMGSFYTVDQLKAFFGSNWLSVNNDDLDLTKYHYNGCDVSMHIEYGLTISLASANYAILVQRDSPLFLRVGMQIGNVTWPQDMNVSEPLYDASEPENYTIAAYGFGQGDMIWEQASCYFGLHIDNSGTIVKIDAGIY